MLSNEKRYYNSIHVNHAVRDTVVFIEITWFIIHTHSQVETIHLPNLVRFDLCYTL